MNDFIWRALPSLPTKAFQLSTNAIAVVKLVPANMYPFREPFANIPTRCSVAILAQDDVIARFCENDS